MSRRFASGTVAMRVWISSTMARNESDFVLADINNVAGQVGHTRGGVWVCLCVCACVCVSFNILLHVYYLKLHSKIN